MLVAAAAGIVAVAGLVGILVRSADDGAGQDFAVAGTELAPERIRGRHRGGNGIGRRHRARRARPSPRGARHLLPGLGQGTGWAGHGGHVPHARRRRHVELWSGVPLDRYPTLTVTLQQEGAGQESSGQVVLSGEVGG